MGTQMSKSKVGNDGAPNFATADRGLALAKSHSQDHCQAQKVKPHRTHASLVPSIVAGAAQRDGCINRTDIHGRLQVTVVETPQSPPLSFMLQVPLTPRSPTSSNEFLLTSPTPATDRSTNSFNLTSRTVGMRMDAGHASTCTTPLSPSLKSNKTSAPTSAMVKPLPFTPVAAPLTSALLERRRNQRSCSLPEMSLVERLEPLYMLSPRQDVESYGGAEGCTSPVMKSPLRLDAVRDKSAEEGEPASPSTPAMLKDQHTRDTRRRRKSLASLQLKPFDGLLESVKVKGKGRLLQRRGSECSLGVGSGVGGVGSVGSVSVSGLESMKSFHAFTSASLSEVPSLPKNPFGSTTSTPPVASIFDEYTAGAERLKYRHVVHLCHDLIDAFIEGYRQRVERELREKHGDVSAKNVEQQMATDLPYMLGDGVHKEKSKWVEIAAKRMWKMLDFNEEGGVSKTKFIARFMTVCEDVLPMMCEVADSAQFKLDST